MALVDNAWYIDFGNGSSTGYYGVAAWAASTSYVCGNLVRQLAAPSVGNERVFVCIASTSGTGTSGGSEPTWTVTRGAKNTDNTVTWQEATGIAALNGDLSANTPTWATVKNTAITLGQVIQNVAGTLILICTTAGTAGNGSEPSWAAFTNAGATTADNTATWTTLGASFSGWSAPHARIANSFATNWGQAGNSFFVASEHAETQASVMNQTLPGTAPKPCIMTCVTKTNVPPGSANVTTGATVATTGNNNINQLNGEGYIQGISYTCGSGANSPSITMSVNGILYFKNCAFKLGGTSGGNLTPGSNGAQPEKIYWDNCTFQVSNTGSSIFNGGANFFWRNTASAIQGATLPTKLFTNNGNNRPSTVLVEGIDLSALGSGKTLVDGAWVCPSNFIFKDCKLGASVTIAGTATDLGSVETQVIRSDSSGTNYRHEKYNYVGTQTVETSVIRTGGAVIGTTGISQKIVTTANSKWILPFEVIPRAVWNALTGSNRTITLYGTWNNASVPNTDDIWFDVEYLGTSGQPLGSFVTTTKANTQATGTGWTSDTSTWGGGGSGAGWSPFSMSVTLSSPQPQLVGSMYIYVKAAKASSTFYIDPLPILS